MTGEDSYARRRAELLSAVRDGLSALEIAKAQKAIIPLVRGCLLIGPNVFLMVAVDVSESR